jgi:hypothetical protein
MPTGTGGSCLWAMPAVVSVGVPCGSVRPKSSTTCCLQVGEFYSDQPLHGYNWQQTAAMHSVIIATAQTFLNVLATRPQAFSEISLLVSNTTPPSLPLARLFEQEGKADVRLMGSTVMWDTYTRAPCTQLCPFHEVVSVVGSVFRPMTNCGRLLTINGWRAIHGQIKVVQASSRRWF